MYTYNIYIFIDVEDIIIKYDKLNISIFFLKKITLKCLFLLHV